MVNEGLKRSVGKKVLTLLMMLVMVGLLAAGGYYFMRYRKEHKQYTELKSQNAELNRQLTAFKADPKQAAQAEADKAIAEVGKLYALPKDEKPQVLTVNDKEASKKQFGSFFDKAENNDISLIYTKAKLAILYRPSSKQIINVSSVTIQDSPSNPSPTP